MKVVPILVSLEESPWASIALHGVREAFPGQEAARVRGIDEALGLAIDGAHQLLIVIDVGKENLERAALALDSAGLPRWAVVSFGSGPELPGVERISESEWSSPVLPQAFRSAVEKHQMRREHARLLGNLLTVGVRFVHDLRAPLGGIVSCSEALSESLAEMPASQKTLFHAVLESTNDLSHRIGQLSIWAKLSGRPSIVSRFNMAQAVDPVIERFEWRIAERGASLAKPDSWPDVLGDVAKSEAVWRILFENVLRHAVKFSKVEVGWRPENDVIRFYLQDNGGGVNAEKRSTLYYPFHLMHEANACSGFGLPIMADLVLQQGGRCGFDDLDGGGSRFSFSLVGGDIFKPAA